MIPYELAQYLESAFLILIAAMTFAAYSSWSKLKAQDLLHKNHTSMVALMAFCLILSIIIGMRPPWAIFFGDTPSYAHKFYLPQLFLMDSSSSSSEWLFLRIMQTCRILGEVNLFFTVVALGYIFFALWGIRRLFKNNSYAGMLFFFGAFSFFTYATNGIRNGLACSIVIAAISFIVAERRSMLNIAIGALLCFAAFSIHKSTALPTVCVVASLFVKNVKTALYFWVFSILLFLVAKGTIASIFMSLGFDDRMTSYITNADEYAAAGNKTGFRIDFLLYSFMPIWLGIYVCIKRKLHDTVYRRLLVTYILANSFWVMLMGASFSNRFAYLSWFLYPVVLAYPCFRMDVWGSRQGLNASKIMLAHVGFTLVMHFIYY